MNELFFIGLIGGFLLGYFFCLWLSAANGVLTPIEPTMMDCYDCLKKITPPEFAFYGGLCKKCYKIRHPDIILVDEVS